MIINSILLQLISFETSYALLNLPWCLCRVTKEDPTARNWIKGKSAVAKYFKTKGWRKNSNYEKEKNKKGIMFSSYKYAYSFVHI